MKTKRYFIVCIIIMALVIAGAVYFRFAEQGSGEQGSSVCKIKEMTFYYLEACEWCNKVKGEGAIAKIEELGIKIKKIDAAVGPIRHKFQGVPAFVIDGKVYEGYRTFEQLSELLGCPAGESGSNL